MLDRKLLPEIALARHDKTSAKIPLLMCLIQASDLQVVVKMCVESLGKHDRQLRESPQVQNNVLVNSASRHFRTYQPELKVD